MLRPPDPATQSSLPSQIQEYASPVKRPRTTEDFLRFCDVVLTYTNYPHAFYQKDEDDRKIESPLNSIGESAHVSAASDTSSRTSSVGEAEADTDEDTWGMVTCWCGKPFAGRPMIECESCLIWLHLSCARVRKSNIPKHFKCAQCKPPKTRRKRQSSDNSEIDHDEISRVSPVVNGTNSTLSAIHSNSSPNGSVDKNSQSVSLSRENSSMTSPYGTSAPASNAHSNHRILNDDGMEDTLFALDSAKFSKHKSRNHNMNHSKTVKSSKGRRSVNRPRPRPSKKTFSNSKNLGNNDALSVRLSYNTSSPLPAD